MNGNADIPVNPLPFPTKFVDVVVPDTFKFPPIVVFPDIVVVPVNPNPPVEHEYSKVLLYTNPGEYSSVHETVVVGEQPPKASPAFCVPAPAKPNLAVIKAPPDDHDVPLYSSVHDLAGKAPPKASPAFCSPATQCRSPHAYLGR